MKPTLIVFLVSLFLAALCYVDSKRPHPSDSGDQQFAFLGMLLFLAVAIVAVLWRVFS